MSSKKSVKSSKSLATEQTSTTTLEEAANLTTQFSNSFRNSPSIDGHGPRVSYPDTLVNLGNKQCLFSRILLFHQEKQTNISSSDRKNHKFLSVRRVIVKYGVRYGHLNVRHPIFCIHHFRMRVILK